MNTARPSAFDEAGLRIPAPPPYSQGDTFREFLDDLAALGVTPVSRGGQPFGVLKARSNDRWWVIPISGGRPSVAAMAMFQPVSLAAKLGKAGVTVAARMAISFGWSSGRVNFAALPKLPGRPAGAIGQCAYFTGTAGPHRKTAIQLMRDDGHILGYAKVSRRSLVRPYLAREAEMLRRVGALGLATANVPAVLGFDPGCETRPTILVTDSRKSIGAASPAVPGVRHRLFLQELAARTGSVGAGLAFETIAELAVDQRLPEAWRTRLLAGLAASGPFMEQLPVALAHGDFTPWNSVVQEDGLYVFDWEYAAENWPLGYDLVHYLLSKKRSEPASLTIERLHAEVTSVLPYGEAQLGRSCVLMSLLLHAAFYLRRQLDCSGSVDGWTDRDFRAGLIDACLQQWRMT